jgi:hypothetical protein
MPLLRLFITSATNNRIAHQFLKVKTFSTKLGQYWGLIENFVLCHVMEL